MRLDVYNSMPRYVLKILSILIFIDWILKIFVPLIVLFDNFILLFEKVLILLEFPALFKAARSFQRYDLIMSLT